MKIRSTTDSPKIQSANRKARSDSAKTSSASSQPATRVSLSADAGFVAGLKEEASNVSESRADMIAETRNQIANGTLEQSVDMDQVIDSLLVDL